MELIIKSFNELSTKELYEILKTRSEIFVVEQNCAYQDIDDLDYDSIHIFIEDDDRVAAYLRIFLKDKNTAQIGRVVSLNHLKGLGSKIMEEAIRQIKEIYKVSKIYLEAQCYAIGFYEKFGFKVNSEEFLEDGIPHVKMILEL